MFDVGCFKNFVWGFAGGVVDTFVSKRTGKRMCIAKAFTAKLANCEPWADHFHQTVLHSANEAVRNGDFADANFLLSLGAKEEANSLCVRLFIETVKLIAMGNDDLFYITPFYWYPNKR